jgi:hypothetical protein
MEEGCVYVWFFLYCEREQTRARQCGCVREVEREHAREILTLGRERDSEIERDFETDRGREREGGKEGGRKRWREAERGAETEREVEREKVWGHLHSPS